MNLSLPKILAAALLLATPAFASATGVWLIEGGRLSRVDFGAGSFLTAPIDEHVRNVAPLGNGGAWVLTDEALTLLDDALVVQSTTKVTPDEAATFGPMVADSSDRGVWIGVGASLLHFDSFGSRVSQWPVDGPVLAIAAAGPDALFVATSTALMRLDSTGAMVAQFDLTQLPGTSSANLLLDPVAGYLWLVRSGAVIQFDALMGLARGAVIAVDGPDAVALDAQNGVLTLVIGQEIRHYDRKASAIHRGAFTSEALIDIAGIDAQLRERILWFGDRTGFGAVDLTDGAVVRIPGGQGVDRFAADPLRFEQRLDADLSGNAASAASTLVTFRVKTYCNGVVCVPSPAYVKGLRLRATRDEFDVSGLFAANTDRDEFVGHIPAAPWQVAPPAGVGHRRVRQSVERRRWSRGRWVRPISAAIVQTASPPTVALTAPLNNATYTAPLSTTIKATATPSTGATISKVDFYVGARWSAPLRRRPTTFRGPTCRWAPTRSRPR